MPKEEKKFLIDQIEYMLENSKSGTLVKSLNIMYENLPEKVDPITGVNLFIEGLKTSGFFSYIEFLESINNGR